MTIMAKMMVDGDWYEFNQGEYDSVYEKNSVGELHHKVRDMYSGYTIGDCQRLPKYKLVAMVAAASPDKD